MHTELTMTQSYNKIVKRIKTFTMIGEFTIFIIRVLAQRIFSVYIGIVLFQFILVTQMSFKTYSVIESKFYLIMNCILFYLLIINFVESQINQTQTIQYVLKDKYIIDYAKIGYPIEFFFRVVATLLMWRVYQYSTMKTIEYGNVGDSQQVESNTHRNDRIHVRENTHEQDGLWALNIRRNNSEIQRNLQNSSRNSQHNLPNNLPNLNRHFSNRDSQLSRDNHSFRNSVASNLPQQNNYLLQQYHGENQQQPHRSHFYQSSQRIQSQILYNNQPFQQFHQSIINQNNNHVTFSFQNQPHSLHHNNQQPN